MICCQIEDFCSQTTAHGVPHIAKKNASVSFRICWIIITVFAFGGNIFHLYRVIHEYVQYPSQETVRQINQLPIFPDVTVCNLSPYSKLVLQNLYRDPENEVFGHANLLDSLREELDHFSAIMGVSGSMFSLCLGLLSRLFHAWRCCYKKE